ncbi:RING-H2 finger protein ATL63-like [Impatiens glandulifera]|uniref:RING-H2 finger protein ATL63-like n=1 Tax=Impatiens glandulifera TaxID=253017 RepID=UPI001FB10777|nr:RING-H2 finger protein ATL63-like [Impatiens glandulifera]
MLGSPSPVSQFFKNMFSYDGNMMLAMAVTSLILVVAFVFLLHVYAKWLLVQARHRSSAGSPINNYLGPRPPYPPPSISHHRYNSTSYESSRGSDMMMTKLGLDPSVIALIPLFVYESSSRNVGLECVICMGQFEEKEVGRELPKCGHSFHVECIDMWLMSHTNCPLCRSAVLGFIQSEEEEECKDTVMCVINNPFVYEEFSHGDCPELNNSSSSNNHNEKDDGGSVLEIVIKVPPCFVVENNDNDD